MGLRLALRICPKRWSISSSETAIAAAKVARLMSIAWGSDQTKCASKQVTSERPIGAKKGSSARPGDVACAAPSS